MASELLGECLALFPNRKVYKYGTLPQLEFCNTLCTHCVTNRTRRRMDLYTADLFRIIMCLYENVSIFIDYSDVQESERSLATIRTTYTFISELHQHLRSPLSISASDRAIRHGGRLYSKENEVLARIGCRIWRYRHWRKQKGKTFEEGLFRRFCDLGPSSTEILDGNKVRNRRKAARDTPTSFRATVRSST